MGADEPITLVIHRDLKPTNILITAGGTPKLLDFGIARLLEENSREASGGQFRAYTPEYASPEVMAGAPMTTAADVFSLGVVLRKLLDGVEAPGDVQAIVGMATQPEAQRRYASAEQLAADLRGFLAGLPVRAREATFAYRTGKFLLRHRLAAGAVALAFAGLSIATGAAMFQARRARGALTVAEKHRQAAEQQAALALEARQVADREHHTAARERDHAVEETHLAEQRLEQLVGLASQSVNSIHDALERIPGATQDRRKIVGETLQFLDRARQGAGGNPELPKTIMAGYLKMSMAMTVPARRSRRDSSLQLCNRPR